MATAAPTAAPAEASPYDCSLFIHNKHTCIHFICKLFLLLLTNRLLANIFYSGWIHPAAPQIGERFFCANHGTVQKNVERECHKCVCWLSHYLHKRLLIHTHNSKQIDPIKFWGDMAKRQLTWKVWPIFRRCAFFWTTASVCRAGSIWQRHEWRFQARGCFLVSQWTGTWSILVHTTISNR